MLISGGFNWVDVRDVCRGAIAAESKGRIGENYILSGFWHSIRDLAQFAEEITGIKPPRLDFPMPLARLAGPLMEALSRVTGAEPRFGSDALASLRANRKILYAKAHKELNYEPRSIRLSVHDTYQWFEDHGMMREPLSYKRFL
jgi:dihydroflavonol-4-reductase